MRKKILLLAVLPLLAALLLIAIAVRHQSQDLAQQERAVVESAYLASKEAELRHHVEMAMNLIEPIYNSGRDDAQAKAEAIRVLNAFEFANQDGYFFAYDYQGNCLVLPRQPELVGQNLWNVQDRNGLYLVQSLVTLAKSGNGYLRYVWNKPSVRQVAPKLGYVVGLQRWGWLIGTGIYLDDVQLTLDKIDSRVHSNVTTTMAWIGGIALLALLLVGGSALALNLSEYRAADAQLQLLARQVVQSQENERAHLSRELHDSTSQTLVSIKLLMDSAIGELQRQGHTAPTTLSQARRRIEDALSEVRSISHRLRPFLLDTLGLASALRHLGEEFAEHAQLAFFMRVHSHGHDPATGRADALPDELPDEIKTVFYRITQEALTNIEKHAHAERVDVRLIFHNSGVRLTVADDGRGFDLAAIEADPRRGIGLRNMRERVEAIGGTFTLQSRPGSTRVIAQVSAAVIQRLAQPTRSAQPPIAHANLSR